MLTIIQMSTTLGQDHIGKNNFFFHAGNRFNYSHIKKKNEDATFTRMYSWLVGKIENFFYFFFKCFLLPCKKTNTLPERVQKSY